MQSVFSEDHPGLTLHSKELHQEHCVAIQQNPALPSTFGVKKTCVSKKLVFQYLIKNDISLISLSERIESFNYGYTQRRNRPSGLKLDDTSNSLSLNAIQSWCLIGNTPLIFGDLVGRDDGHWNLLLLLIQIVTIVFFPYCNPWYELLFEAFDF